MRRGQVCGDWKENSRETCHAQPGVPDGKPVAALVGAELFGRIRHMQERFDALSQQIAQAFAQVPVEPGLAEIDTAVAAERKSR